MGRVAAGSRTPAPEKREKPSGFLERAPSGMTSGLGLVGRVFSWIPNFCWGQEGQRD